MSNVHCEGDPLTCRCPYHQGHVDPPQPAKAPDHIPSAGTMMPAEARGIVQAVQPFARAADRLDHYDGENYDAPLYACKCGGSLRELLNGIDGEPLTVNSLRHLRAALSATLSPQAPSALLLEKANEIAGQVVGEDAAHYRYAWACARDGALAALASPPADTAEMSNLNRALADLDKAKAECPAQKGIGSKPCPKCRATPSDSCWRMDAAGYAVVQAAKALAAGGQA